MRHLLRAIPLLLAACAGTSVAVTELPPGATLPKAALHYDRPMTAVQQADFAGLAASPETTAEERELAEALADVWKGRFEEAEPALATLSATASGEVRGAATAAHICVLMHLSRWADILRVHGDSSEAAGLVPLVKGWASSPPERVTFSAASATLPLSLEDVDLPFVQVHVGERPYLFLLDTGATFTLISSEVAEAAGIVPAAAGADIATATTRQVGVKPAVIPHLSLGNAAFENHPCIVADPRDLQFKSLVVSFLRLDGVIGWNAIRHLDLEIDERARSATIRKPAPRVVEERNLSWLGAPIVRAHFPDGVPFLSGLDTGASASSLFPEFFTALPDAYRDAISGKSREGSTRVWGAGGAERVATRTVKTLTVIVDRHVLEFRNVEAHGRTLVAIFVPVLQLGNDIARKGTMRIDFTNGALELGR
jgi:predicted aspartyl protease